MRGLIDRLRSDDALMQAYQRGDADAFESLYRRHKDGLFAFLYRSCGQGPVVEEVAQDTWLAVISSAASYRTQGNFKTWLYRMGRNRLVDYWRRRDNAHRSLSDAEEPEANPSGQPGEDATADIMSAVAALPAEQRDTVLLREQGFSLADIAHITDAGEETVKSRLRYARKQLRIWLEAEPGASHE